QTALTTEFTILPVFSRLAIGRVELRVFRVVGPRCGDKPAEADGIARQSPDPTSWYGSLRSSGRIWIVTFLVGPLQKVEQLIDREPAEMAVHEVEDFGLLDAA